MYSAHWLFSRSEMPSLASLWWREPQLIKLTLHNSLQERRASFLLCLEPSLLAVPKYVLLIITWSKYLSFYSVLIKLMSSHCQTHLPGFLEMHDQLKSKGVDVIACIAVNDPFVMAAWGMAHDADGKVNLLNLLIWPLTFHSREYFIAVLG